MKGSPSDNELELKKRIAIQTKVQSQDKAVEKRIKNMIVRTCGAAYSANGSTDMHSKSGKATINHHHIFRENNSRLPVRETRDQQ